MKKILAALIISIIALSASAQEHLKVKGIPIDGNLETFMAKMKNAGLKYNARLSQAVEVPVLEGEFAGMSNCKFSILHTDDKTVCKVIISTDDIGGWYSTKSKYLEMKELLSSKYELSSSYEYFDDPYYEGDGYELSAIRLEKGTYVSYFHCDEGFVTLEVRAASSSKGYLNIRYQDTINMNKYTEERDKKISDDI